MSTMTQKDSQYYIELENKYGAHNYHPLPAVLERGEGVFVWDVDGKKYYDFLSAYSAVNQGHCHPRLVKAITEQASVLTLTSRAFYSNLLGQFEEKITKLFGFDKVLAMNSGAEGVETAIKIARKWGYEKKGIPSNQAKIVVCGQNFHGRTTTIISFSDDEVAKGNFGPYTPGFESVEYNNIASLEKAFENPEHIAAFMLEPIQGEAGVFVPADEFVHRAKELCEENNVLFIADEIQTGIARTGKLLAIHHLGIKPDMLILGKALSGGFYPVSAVLANNDVMNVIQPGQHGSTFGGNPMACRIAMEALDIVHDENLAENADRLGKIFREKMAEFIETSNVAVNVRGRGLLNAVVVNDTEEGSLAWNICMKLRDNGLLAKPTHGNIIRFAPPLVMTEEQILDCVSIITKTFQEFEK